MILLAMGRGEGKTYVVLTQLAINKSAGLLVSSSAAARKKIDYLRDMQKKSYITNDDCADAIRRIFYTTDQLVGQRIQMLYIDDLEFVLAGLLRHPVELATISSSHVFNAPLKKENNND